MKNRYAIQASILTFLLALTFNFYGQSSLGISSGINLSNGNFENNGALVRYALGLQSQIPLNNKFSLNPCLYYSVKGWKFKSFVPPEDGGEMNLQYIDLQILGKYSFYKKSSFLGGVELGRLIKTRRDPYVSLFNDFYEKSDISLVIGIDYSIVKTLRFAVKYLHGLSYLTKFNTTDINGNNTGVDKEGNFRVIQFIISVDLIKIKDNGTQQLSVRCVRSTDNERYVARNLR